MNKKVVLKFIELLSYLYPLKLIKAFKIFNRYLYSEKIKRCLKNSGENFRVFMPLNIKGMEYIEVGDNFTAHEGMILQCYDKYEKQNFEPSIQIGENAYFGMNCHIGCINKIVIGNNFLAGGHVYITDHAHGKIIMEESRGDKT